MSTNAHAASEKPKDEPVKPEVPDEPKPAPKPEKEEPHARARQHK